MLATCHEFTVGKVNRPRVTEAGEIFDHQTGTQKAYRAIDALPVGPGGLRAIDQNSLALGASRKPGRACDCPRLGTAGTARISAGHLRGGLGQFKYARKQLPSSVSVRRIPLIWIHVGIKSSRCSTNQRLTTSVRDATAGSTVSSEPISARSPRHSAVERAC